MVQNGHSRVKSEPNLGHFQANHQKIYIGFTFLDTHFAPPPVRNILKHFLHGRHRYFLLVGLILSNFFKKSQFWVNFGEPDQLSTFGSLRTEKNIFSKTKNDTNLYDISTSFKAITVKKAFWPTFGRPKSWYRNIMILTPSCCHKVLFLLHHITLKKRSIIGLVLLSTKSSSIPTVGTSHSFYSHLLKSQNLI